MMEVEISKEDAQKLADLMDSAEFEVYAKLLGVMLERNHILMEKEEDADNRIRLQGDCRRLRRLLEFRKFLIQSVKQNGATQAKD